MAKAEQARGNKEHIAHARLRDDGTWDTPHSLVEHLTAVAMLAKGFSESFGNGDWGYLAGLWHDLGKYKEDFQNYIRQASGFEREEADEGGPGKVDHTAAGAIHAVRTLGPAGKALAYLIAGHHSGLPDWYKMEARGRALVERLAEESHLTASINGGAPRTILDQQAPSSPPCAELGLAPEVAHLWLRMLFSALVDADFLDTEAYMSPARAAARSDGEKKLDLRTLKRRFDLYMVSKSTRGTINELRAEILAHCRAGAAQRPGLFSLTVPTGGGKTLASIGFALEHALQHGKKRIIIAIPYTSIIEQTADVLRKVFGDEAVLEHHSNLDPDKESPQSKLATENWDAPIIVTTNVQLFESLFASRTSACRKLHNIVNSIIILDEAQMLPPEFLKPILSALKVLVSHFGISALLCTATQPALVGHIGPRARGSAGGFIGVTNVIELMPDPDALAKSFRRVEVEVRDPQVPVQWEDLAPLLAQSAQVLCIVNTRRHCRELHALMPAGTIHLSALLCGEHRSRAISDIKTKLSAGEPTRVISTQLVEAGVDLDFPVVYRALAGLDSIAQAAGRCNREGRLDTGKVVVFAPPQEAPNGLLRQGEYATRELLRVSSELATSLRPEAFRAYFSKFYERIDSFDKHGVLDLLVCDERELQFQFRTAAQKFRLVDDEDQHSIIVWYESEKFNTQKLIEDLERFGPSRTFMRRLQRCTVNVPERSWRDLADQGAIRELGGPKGPLGLWAQAIPGVYDPIFGLRLEGPAYDGYEYVR